MNKKRCCSETKFSNFPKKLLDFFAVITCDETYAECMKVEEKETEREDKKSLS